MRRENCEKHPHVHLRPFCDVNNEKKRGYDTLQNKKDFGGDHKWNQSHIGIYDKHGNWRIALWKIQKERMIIIYISYAFTQWGSTPLFKQRAACINAPARLVQISGWWTFNSCRAARLHEQLIRTSLLTVPWNLLMLITGVKMLIFFIFSH